MTVAIGQPGSLPAGPAWARTVAEVALGDHWPTGDEVATWDLADRWYGLAAALATPRLSAFAAADQIMAGMAGAGIALDGFREAWERLAGGDDAPLNALVQIAAELGQMVEECAREIEAAKLTAWIEVGTLLTELSTLPMAIELTLGAAGLAAEGLVTASRVAIERIYADLATRLEGQDVTPIPTTDPAHSARSDQRTVRLTAPLPDDGSTSSAATAEKSPGTPRRPCGPSPARTGGDETRRRSPADRLPPPDVATRRLAPRPRTADPEVGDATRRLVAPPASGRPTIPRPRMASASEPVRLDEYADYLSSVAGSIRANFAIVGTDPALAAYADEVEAEAARTRARPGPQLDPAPAWARPEPPPDPAPASNLRLPLGPTPTWGRLEPPPNPAPSLPDLPLDPIPTWGGPASPRRERPTDEHAPGGLRAASGLHRKALRDALPTAGRRPDPRVGRWFSLLNAGGPGDDPTRGVNCLDAVLALFETYQLGQPRVADPRTFDGYGYGAPERPIGGEWGGVRRIQQAARAGFQNLCPFVGGASAEQAEKAADAAFRNLANHLHNSGHGAFAFVLTDFSTGGCHAWAAVNQDGVILFLDPQLGLISEEVPLYRQIVSMDALVVDGDGEPAPLPYHGAGQWTAF